VSLALASPARRERPPAGRVRGIGVERSCTCRFEIESVNRLALTLALSRKRERGTACDISNRNMLRCVFPTRRRWD
jgi:hypothetical protein